MSTPTPALPHRGQYDPARAASQLYLLWQVRPHSKAAACFLATGKQLEIEGLRSRDLEEKKEYNSQSETEWISGDFWIK